MELTTLRQFVAIAQAGHLTRAAQSLGVTQPALSAMLKKLELETGAPLVHRSSRGVELTDAGRLFLEHARDAVRRADEAVRAVHELVGLQRGSIRVGGGATATTYLLPRVVREVRGRHAGLRFYVREAGSSAVAAAVLNGELDLGIVTLPIPDAVAADLSVAPLVEDELRLILPPVDAIRPSDRAERSRAAEGQSSRAGRESLGADLGALARAGSAFRWKDLEGVPIVAFEAGTAVRALIDHSAARAGVALNVVMELRSIESIKRMVEAGIGAGFVSRFAIDPLADGEGLACRDGKLSRKLAIVKRRGRPLSAAAAEFERELLTTVRRSA